MKSYHTKGPWKVIDGFDDAGEGRLFPSVIMGKKARLVVNESHDQTPKSIMANAKLIAAAPEMKDIIISFLRTGYHDTETGKQAIALLDRLGELYTQ